MGRSPCCEKKETNKGAWTKEEDQRLLSYIRLHGDGSWRSLPKPAGLLRCGKSCRLRWINYLRPDLKRGNFSPEEDELIIKLHSLLGNKWSLIAARLPGRTDNEIKNYWNTHIKRKLITRGIDPQTHRPFITSAASAATTTTTSAAGKTLPSNLELKPTNPSLISQFTLDFQNNNGGGSNEGGGTCSSGTTTDDGPIGHKAREIDLELTIGLTPFQAQAQARGRSNSMASSAESKALVGPSLSPSPSPSQSPFVWSTVNIDHDQKNGSKACSNCQTGGFNYRYYY